jgi:hypothetical protein
MLEFLMPETSWITLTVYLEQADTFSVDPP